MSFLDGVTGKRPPRRIAGAASPGCDALIGATDPLRLPRRPFHRQANRGLTMDTAKGAYKPRVNLM